MRAAVGASDDLGGVVAGCPAVEGALARCWARAGCGALVGGHQDLPAGGHEDGMAVITVSDRIPRSLRRESAAESVACTGEVVPDTDHPDLGADRPGY
jgi:hypothetical protein